MEEKVIACGYELVTDRVKGIYFMRITLAKKGFGVWGLGFGVWGLGFGV